MTNQINFIKDKISYIIPTYNSSRFIAKALKSIVDDIGTSGLFEILIIDDCSEDINDTVDIIKKFPNTRLIKKRIKTNAAESRNIGIKKSTGEFLFFLDSDDSIINGYSRRRVDLHKDTQSGVIFGNFMLNNNDANIIPYYKGDLREYLFIYGGDMRSSTISIHKRSYKGTIFDKDQFKHQDWGFAIRAYESGEKVFFDKEPLVNIDNKANDQRMSSLPNIQASDYFLKKYFLTANQSISFIRRNLKSVLMDKNLESSEFMKKIIKEKITQASLSYMVKALLYYFALSIPKSIINRSIRNK